MRKFVTFAIALLFSCWLGLFAALVMQGQETKPADRGIFTPAAIQFKDGPPSLPSGAKWVVLEGHPSKEGLVTMRVSFPGGYKVPPHWHPVAEHVTVISGTFNMGMGDQFDKSKGNKLPAGSFFFLPPKTHHFVWTQEGCVIQIHATGPWDIVYLNPADDPRRMKK